MSDVNTIKRLLNQAKTYKLSGYDFVSGFSLEELAADYNGIGPEWFSATLREAIDKIHPDLQCVAMIHDVRWAHSNGTYLAFSESNAELASNGEAVAYQKYSWYDPRRYIRARQARLFSSLCQTFGYSAYRNAYNEHRKG